MKITTSLALLLADTPSHLPNLEQSPPSTTSDPLIDQSGEITIYISSFLLIIGIAALVGVFSRRVEFAFFTALSLSVIPILFFLLSKH